MKAYSEKRMKEIAKNLISIYGLEFDEPFCCTADELCLSDEEADELYQMCVEEAMSFKSASEVLPIRARRPGKVCHRTR